MKSILVAVLFCLALAAHAGTIATEQNALSTTAELISAGNGAKFRVFVRNLDGTIKVYIGAADTVTSSNGWELRAGEIIEIRSTAAIYAIAASGTPNIAVYTESQ